MDTDRKEGVYGVCRKGVHKQDSTKQYHKKRNGYLDTNKGAVKREYILLCRKDVVLVTQRYTRKIYIRKQIHRRKRKKKRSITCNKEDATEE